MAIILIINHLVEVEVVVLIGVRGCILFIALRIYLRIRTRCDLKK